jgi:hypothetical protein
MFMRKKKKKKRGKKKLKVFHVSFLCWNAWKFYPSPPKAEPVEKRGAWGRDLCTKPAESFTIQRARRTPPTPGPGSSVGR